MITSSEISLADSSTIEVEIKAAQTKYIFDQLPRLLFYNAASVIGLAIILSPNLDKVFLSFWVVVSLALLAYRYKIYKQYINNTGNISTDAISTDAWARRFVIFASLSGFAWGIGSYILFVPDHMGNQAILIMVLAGIIMVPTAILSVYLPALYLYVPAVTIPSGMTLFILGQDFHTYTGAFFFALTGFMVIVGRNINIDFRDRVKLDVTNQNLLLELEQQKSELERANLAKSKFLASAGHDVRQPLHALSIFSELLIREQATQPPDNKPKKLAQNINTCVQALDGLFASLLDVSRLEAGVVTKHSSVFQVKDIVLQVVNECEADAIEKNLVLHFDECDFHTETDPDLLHRILLNLVANAIFYTKTGGITIRCISDSNHIKLSVEDTGVGIPLDQQQFIFDDFYQVDNPERDSSKGLGLGLTIVRGLTELLDLRLELISEPGRGTTVTLTLPLRQRPEKFLSEQSEEEPMASEVSIPLSVLVVEDAEQVREGMQLLLESWDCIVYCAQDAEQAQNIVAGKNTVDAMIVDYRLPGQINGLQLIKGMRESDDKHVPALLVTGETDPQVIVAAKQSGLDLLHKPTKASDLQAWLLALIPT